MSVEGLKTLAVIVNIVAVCATIAASMTFPGSQATPACALFSAGLFLSRGSRVGFSLALGGGTFWAVLVGTTIDQTGTIAVVATFWWVVATMVVGSFALMLPARATLRVAAVYCVTLTATAIIALRSTTAMEREILGSAGASVAAFLAALAMVRRPKLY